MLRLGDDYAYRWTPFQGAANSTFHTNGKWQTVTVPLSEFKTAKDGNEGAGNNAVTLGSLLTADGKATFTYRIVSEGKPIDVFNAAFDNIRIVALN